MIQTLLLIVHFFSYSAEGANHHIYDLLIKFDQASIEPYKSNLYFNEPMTVKEIKVIIKRNERIRAPLEAIKMFREGGTQEMQDAEMLGVDDPGSRSLIIKAPY